METRILTSVIAEDLLRGGFVLEVSVNGQRRADLDKHVPTREEAEDLQRKLGLPDFDPQEWDVLLF
jgi:hypothetical protein